MPATFMEDGEDRVFRWASCADEHDFGFLWIQLNEMPIIGGICPLPQITELIGQAMAGENREETFVICILMEVYFEVMNDIGQRSLSKKSNWNGGVVAKFHIINSKVRFKFLQQYLVVDSLLMIRISDSLNIKQVFLNIQIITYNFYFMIFKPIDELNLVRLAMKAVWTG